MMIHSHPPSGSSAIDNSAQAAADRFARKSGTSRNSAYDPVSDKLCLTKPQANAPDLNYCDKALARGLVHRLLGRRVCHHIALKCSAGQKVVQSSPSIHAAKYNHRPLEPAGF